MRTPGEIIEQILTRRNIADPDEFFADKPRATHDPFLLPDMEEGADVIHRHIIEGKNICVYGDYDVDGLMSVTLLTGFLESLPDADAKNISWYIPSRFDEGYGLNREATERIRADGVDLIVTVDCGVVPASEVKAALDAGMAVVVTDHHAPDPDALPESPSIDPKMPGSAYPFTGLCGCGVAFKLAQAIRARHYPDDAGVRAAMNSALDLVAIATIADVTPLTDENRTLVKYGLRALNAGARWQLRELIDGVGLKPGEIKAHQVAFVIAPHLNAAGRLGDAAPVVRLLKTEDREEARAIIAELVERNALRRREQEDAVAACMEIIDAEYPGDDFLLVKPPHIHEGVAGIVAGKVKEKYGRPVAVLSQTGEGEELLLKGSARSVPGVDVISLIRRHEELFTRFGGHAMAAGFTLRPEHEEALREAISADIGELLRERPDLFSPETDVDADILPEEASIELAHMLDRFEPAGADNPRPVLRLRAQTPEGIRRMGAEQQHMKFTAGGLACVLFARGGESAGLPGDGQFDLYGSLGVNSWNERETVQFIVREAICSKSKN
ncbi:MAG: single-stranded-DNA-specific exonuclease RecJ [Clostridiales Family XIII bacterium]|jgi:single-stranded-DNA-specific exonuclease|nr:single-stranded-DNA-specific exonuclease RecJ [Clostridiales Family XIII bacterium]